MDWTEEVIRRLRALWAEGHSTAEIGRRMGVSKNAVVGKAHRLALPARPSPIRRGDVGQAKQTAPRRTTGPTLPPLGIHTTGHAALPPGERGRAPDPGFPSVPAADAAAPQTAASLARLALAPMSPQSLASPGLASPGLASHGLASHGLASHGLASPGGGLQSIAPGVGHRGGRRHVACCWPIGEPGTRSFRFCDAQSVAGKPYCAEHAALAYVKVRDRREEAA